MKQDEIKKIETALSDAFMPINVDLYQVSNPLDKQPETGRPVDHLIAQRAKEDAEKLTAPSAPSL